MAATVADQCDTVRYNRSFSWYAKKTNCQNWQIVLWRHISCGSGSMWAAQDRESRCAQGETYVQWAACKLIHTHLWPLSVYRLNVQSFHLNTNSCAIYYLRNRAAVNDVPIVKANCPVIVGNNGHKSSAAIEVFCIHVMSNDEPVRFPAEAIVQLVRSETELCLWQAILCEGTYCIIDRLPEGFLALVTMSGKCFGLTLYNNYTYTLYRPRAGTNP